MWSDAHVSMASSSGGSGEIGCSLAGASPKGQSGCQTKSGASGSELLVARKHVPDRVGETAGDIDLGDLRPALLAEPPLVSLVALGVGGVLERVHRRLDERPAQIAGPVLGQGPAPVGVARLVDARAKPGVAGELLGALEALDLADLGGDRERQDPADPGGTNQQRDVGVVGVALPKAPV